MTNAKILLSMLLMVLSVFVTSSSFAQDTTFMEDDTYEQMLNYSRPGKYHQALAELVGNWRFTGGLVTGTDSATNKVSEGWSGTATRKSVANGLFFISDIIFGDTIEMLGQDGKMKKAKLWINEVEGYDNVKNEFQKTSITNQLTSAITYCKGKYDSATKTITYHWVAENIPGIITKMMLHFVFVDKNHYKLKYYQPENGKYVQVTELNFTRTEDK